MQAFSLDGALNVGEALTALMNAYIEGFRPLNSGIVSIVESLIGLAGIYFGMPTVVLIPVSALIGWFVRGLTLSIGITLACFLIYGMGLWQSAAETLALMSVAVFASVVIGIPVGILLAEFRPLWKVASPILDTLQTVHPFVYLIPTVLAFGIGNTPAILAAVLYTTPLPIRLTYLGVSSADKEVIEAARAFGANRFQILLKVKLPLSVKFVLSGLNQAILITLSFIVVAALIGAGGLGTEIIRSVTRLRPALGFEAGLAVVLLAFVLDRVTSGLAENTMTRFVGGKE